MDYIHNTDDFCFDRASVVTLGKFDGVHIGHQKLIAKVLEKAEEYNCQSVVLTFDRMPLKICPASQQYYITVNSEKREIVEDLGVDVMIEYPFSEKFMNMDAEEFISEILVKQLHTKCIVAGPDCSFGKDKAGNAQMLIDLSEKYGYETIVLEKEKYEDREISSTFVREELKIGHMETVNMLLGRPYSVKGVIVRGNQIGRTIEIPTVNIYPPESKILPPNGVYASETIVKGIKYLGITNIGTKPTITDKKQISVETFLFDFNEDVYGETIEVFLKHFQRPEMKFDSVESLSKQMKQDVAFTKEMFMI